MVAVVGEVEVDSDKAARSEIGAIPSKRAHEALSAPQPRRNAEGPRRGATGRCVVPVGRIILQEQRWLL